MTANNPALPLDSDVEVDDRLRRMRPVHLRPALVVLVVVGGAVGTTARELISLAAPEIAGFPVAVFAINLTGAFLLGILLEALARRGPDAGLRQRLRLLLGTGFCGGFTTYSSLAAASATFVTSGDTWKAVVYGAATIIFGFFASLAGISVATAARREPGQ